MKTLATVTVLEEVGTGPKGDGWQIFLQFCKYNYDSGNKEKGYRFIYRKPDTGNLYPARGQTRIPSLDIALELINKAKEQGWGDYIGD